MKIEHPRRNTKDKTDDILAALERSLSASMLSGFIKYTFPGYLMGWFQQAVCHELDIFLDQVIAKKSPRLIITAPPRHGKSEIVSRRFPAYILGRYPNTSIIATSYSSDLSSANNRAVQRIIDSDLYRHLFPHVMLPGFIPKSSQQTAIKRTSSVFEVVGYEGSYRSAGVDGAITGMGGECVVEGTFISTPMGVKKIEELGAGDLVLSYNRTTDKIERTRINKTKCVGIYKDVIWIKTRGGRSVCLTNEHPVCTYNDGYVSAYDLEIDTKILSILLTKKGTSILVTDIIENIEPYKHLGYVYDLEVDQNHNYFANGVLVHNCLIIDDPIKTNAEADSLIMRDHLWNWYKSTFYTRLNSGGGIVIIQTRWHEDDLVGRLLDADRAYDDNKWKILNFPAIAEVDDEYRKAGEALHPERYPLEQLELTKRSSGSRAWASLYQQRPAPEEGHIFHREWFKYWNQQELPKDFTKIISSWDMSFKDTKTSDFVVGQVWGIRGGSFYLLDQIRKRMGFVETCEAFERIVKRWPQTREKLVEDKANGTGVIDFLKRKISGIIPISPTESKVARANMVTVFFEAGNVFFPPKNMYPWVDDLEAELCTFPTGVHDDQVDSLTQALTRLYRHGPLRISNWKGTVSNAPQIGSRSSFNLSYGRVNPRRPFHG